MCFRSRFISGKGQKNEPYFYGYYLKNSNTFSGDSGENNEFQTVSPTVCNFKTVSPFRGSTGVETQTYLCTKRADPLVGENVMVVLLSFT
jgi:hypothetical protein